MNHYRTGSDRSATVIAAILLLLSVTRSARAQEDLDYQAEHLIESGMNYRLASFPTTGDELVAKPSSWALAVGGGSTGTSAFDLQGPMLAAAAGWRVGQSSGVEVSLFFDQFDISGPGGNQVLHPLWSKSIPLVFPQDATISDPGGQVEHWGVGAAWLWQPGHEGFGDQEQSRWLWRFGLFYSRVEVDGFQADYRLVADPAVEGVIDYDESYSYVWPWVDLEKHFPLGRRWRAAPHAGLFIPLPAQGFAARMTGPGFDISGDTESANGISHMGDPHLALGMRFDHRPSGLSVDLGATVFTALAESVEHEGVDTAFVIQLVWHL